MAFSASSVSLWFNRFGDSHRWGQPQRHRGRGDGRWEMGDRGSTAGADSLADTPALKRLVFRGRSLAAKERKERKADTFPSLCSLCSFAAGNPFGRVRLAIAVRGRKPLERSRAGVGGLRGRGLRGSQSVSLRDQSVIRRESVLSPSQIQGGHEMPRHGLLRVLRVSVVHSAR